MEFKRTWLALLIVLIGHCLLLVQACGGGAQSETIPQSGAGSLAVRVNWPDGGDSAIGTASGLQAASVDCQIISTVEVQIYWPDTDYTFQASGGPWACELAEGRVEKIPTRAGYTVVLVARNTNGHIIYHGSQDGVNVNDGQTTEVEITALPFQPQDPSPDNGTESNAVDLNWAPVEGAVHYEITISTNEDLSDSTTFEAQSPPFSPPGLAGSTTYYWQVMAVDAFGNMGVRSEIRNFSLTLGVPTLILPEEGFIVTESKVTCEWSEIADSTYHLYIATDMAMTNLAVDAPVDSTSYTFSDLTKDIAYYLQV
jgi:hypothetical protein